MNQLRVRTEFSFLKAYGQLSKLTARLKAIGARAAAITDDNTFGHVTWAKECTNADIKPIFGIELSLLTAPNITQRIALLAKTNDGLRELYNISSEAAISPLHISKLRELSANVAVLSGTVRDPTLLKGLRSVYQEINPSQHLPQRWPGFRTVFCSSNRYPHALDRAIFNLLTNNSQVSPQHLLDRSEMRALLGRDAFKETDRLAEECNATLPKAENVRWRGKETLMTLCRAGIKRRGLRWTEEYETRLMRELAMIQEKKFEDYFLVISDLCRWAKRHMLVGPARGSSAGSLVCYLAYITEIDPLVHGLMFERFIDVTRADLPDIDIDFPDVKRHMILTYLREKYGTENVAHIGTVSRYQPKSILTDIGKRLKIPAWEMKEVKDAIIERTSGDARANACLQDTLESTIPGQALLTKYPALKYCFDLENHARHSGIHAAGLIICNSPVRNYCTVTKDGVAQIDKKDAEHINLLKIDALGLRTLSIIEGAGVDILSVPLDDKGAFAVLNDERWAGVFQFEGFALQQLTKQMGIRNFNDITAITALARPGPLHCGGANAFIERRVGKAPTEYIHPLARSATEDTLGIVVYQEQVMSIGRDVGRLSWEDVSELRKAMSKSLGDEFFHRYWDKFLAGAEAQGIKPKTARAIWENICTFGSWAFNKSHAVSYAIISYWCAYLKAHHLLEFSAATLRNAKDDEQTILILRELHEEGIGYIAFDALLSDEDWAVKDGKLVGGFLGLKGIGPAKAKELIARRGAWTPKQQELIAKAERLYGNIFPAQALWGKFYDNPSLLGVRSGDTIARIATLKEPGEYLIIGQMKSKDTRDLNEYNLVVKRGGKRIERDTTWLQMWMEDDTGRVFSQVNRWDYERLGREIAEKGVIGEWYLLRGEFDPAWNRLTIKKLKILET